MHKKSGSLIKRSLQAFIEDKMQWLTQEPMALKQRNCMYPEKNWIVLMTEPVLDDAEQKFVLRSPQGMYHIDVSVRYGLISSQ